MVARIALTTDFSPESHVAFLHALRLAVQFRCKLDLLHVFSPTDDKAWASFPHVRQTLQTWNLLPAGVRREEVFALTGIEVNKVEIAHADAAAGIARFVEGHKPDMIVASTHGRNGLGRLLAGSVTDAVAKTTHTPTLLIGPEAKPFVNKITGELHLNSVLVPVAPKPSPAAALDDIYQLLGALPVRLHLVHVREADNALSYGRFKGEVVNVIDGPVVETILQAAHTFHADVIAMPTEGRHGLLDALRGSTTQRVLHDAPCPVLALPA